MINSNIKDRENTMVDFTLKKMGLELLCENCGTELPLLHPHIIAERNDDDGNLICETCWENDRLEKKGVFSKHP